MKGFRFIKIGENAKKIPRIQKSSISYANRTTAPRATSIPDASRATSVPNAPRPTTAYNASSATVNPSSPIPAQVSKASRTTSVPNAPRPTTATTVSRATFDPNARLTLTAFRAARFKQRFEASLYSPAVKTYKDPVAHVLVEEMIEQRNLQNGERI